MHLTSNFVVGRLLIMLAGALMPLAVTAAEALVVKTPNGLSLIHI